MQIGGAGVGEGYKELFKASFRVDGWAWGSWLTSSLPLMLVGLGVALPYRAGLFNVGGEGQLLTGALVGVYISTSFGGGPGAFLLPLLAAFGAAAALGGRGRLAEVPRGNARRDRHDDHVQLHRVLRHHVPAARRVEGIPTSPMRRAGPFTTGSGWAALPATTFPTASSSPSSSWPPPSTSWTTRAWDGGWVCWVRAMRWRSARGCEPRAQAGRWRWALRRGAWPGWGGVVELLGNQYRIGAHFSPGWGFTAIAVALLARGKMLPVVPFALYFGFLQNGEVRLQAILGIPGNLVLILVAAPVIIVAAVYGFRAYRRTVMGRHVMERRSL